MTFNSKLPSKTSRRQAGALLSVFLVTCSNLCLADVTKFDFGGHTKTRLLAQTFPDDSIFHDLTGSTSFDAEADLRLNLDAGNGPWSFNASYQVFALYGEQVEYTRGLQQGSGLFFNRFPEDERRLFDLNGVISDDNKFAALHRPEPH